jgi:hypothetical protein
MLLRQYATSVVEPQQMLLAQQITTLVGSLGQLNTSLVEAYKQQREALFATIAGVRDAVNTAGLSDLALFKKNRAQLDLSLGQFAAGGTDQEQLQLAQEITALVNTLQQQGAPLFRGAGDDAGLALFKQTLNDALNTVEGAISQRGVSDTEQQAVLGLLNNALNYVEGTTAARELEDIAAQNVLLGEQNSALDVIETDAKNIFNLLRTEVIHQVNLLSNIFTSSQSVGELLSAANGRLDFVADILKGADVTDPSQAILLTQTTLLTGISATGADMVNLTKMVVNRLEHVANAVAGRIISFQTEPGEMKQVQHTGLALVHQGELIGRPGGGGGSIIVNIDARGASDPQAIGRTTASAIRQTLRQLQQSTRYRQVGGL